jgi:hypothetical protein
MCGACHDPYLFPIASPPHKVSISLCRHETLQPPPQAGASHLRNCPALAPAGRCCQSAVCAPARAATIPHARSRCPAPQLLQERRRSRPGVIVVAGAPPRRRRAVLPTVLQGSWGAPASGAYGCSPDDASDAGQCYHPASASVDAAVGGPDAMAGGGRCFHRRPPILPSGVASCRCCRRRRSLLSSAPSDATVERHLPSMLPSTEAVAPTDATFGRGHCSKVRLSCCEPAPATDHPAERRFLL